VIAAAVTLVAVGGSPGRADARTPSAEAFSACREQEKIGDARACWALWMQKFGSSGSESEVAYAQEHAGNMRTSSEPSKGSETGGPTAVALSANPPALVEVDGKKIGLTPIARLNVTPGDHTAVFQRWDAGRGMLKAVKPFTATAGETLSLEAKAEDFHSPSEKAAPEKAASESPTTGSGPAPAPGPQSEGGDSKSAATNGTAHAAASGTTGYRGGGDVLDLCALEPKKDATRFQKQRVVVFAPADAAQLNDDAKVKAQDGGKLVRDIFTARFPLPRFHNVVTELPAKKEWASQDALTVEAIQAYVKQPDDEGDKDRTARLDKEREFVGYSVACTDYVVVPVITSHETKWEDKKVKTSKGEQTVKSLNLKLGGTLAIFKRDGSGFKKIAALDESVPSIADMMSDTVTANLPPMKVAGVDLLDAAAKIPDLPKYVSAVPDPQCLAGKVGKGGAAALAECVKGEGTTEQAFGGLDERLGPVCRKAKDASGSERDDLNIQCEVRARAFQLSRAFQKDARSVEGWKLFGVLAKKGDDPSFALGKDEGVKVGYAFQVLDPGGDRLGFFKVTNVGAGGESGEKEPTVLSLRSGEATEGARLEEYPQLGLVITPFGSGGIIALNSGPTTVSGGGHTAQFTLPTFAYGGGANFGWDLSGLLGWVETYARVDGGVLFGAGGAGTSAMFFPIDVWFEKGFYLGKTVTFLTALGPSMQITKLTVTPPGNWTTFPQNLSLSTTQYGAALRLGLDFFLGPEWGLRTELFGRIPVTTASYSEDNGLPMQGFNTRNDRYATFGLNLGVTKGF
jgi:hypothetical protein